MNYVVPPEAPDHLPLATLPCLPEQCSHCGENFSKKSSLSKHILVVHGASRPSKIPQDSYLAKLMVHRRTSFAICYITFNTRISFKKHMKKGAHLLASGPASVEGGFVREFILLLDGMSVGEKAQEGQRVHPSLLSSRQWGDILAGSVHTRVTYNTLIEDPKSYPLKIPGRDCARTF